MKFESSMEFSDHAILLAGVRISRRPLLPIYAAVLNQLLYIKTF
jgi:hypothetical protein